MNDVSALDHQIGTRVRALRAGRELSLDDLAERSGVSRAMLSRVERGESSPTAQLLNRVCGGLGVTLSTLFAAAEAPVSPVSRRAAQAVWRDPASGYLRRIVSPQGTGSAAEIIEVEFPPRGSVAFETMRLAGVDQHVWVLSGELEMVIGEDAHRLGAGDCLYMRFDNPIVFRNPLDEPVRYAVVISRGGVMA